MTDVWFRTGHWPSRQFPAEFQASAPVRQKGQPVAVGDVPIGETFEVLSEGVWNEATRVAPPKTFHFVVAVEVDGDDGGEDDIAERVRGNLDVNDFRSVSVRELG